MSSATSRFDLRERIDADLRELTAHRDRRVGGPGNLAATAMFAERVAALGFEVSRTWFDCIDWAHGDAVLGAGAESFDAHVGPYSPACDTEARLVAASNLEALEREPIAGAIVLLHGEIAAHQVMPKNFTFYNPEGHRRLVATLERGRPAAVIAATGRDPDMVGSQYPFPLFEDGDLEVPNAYLKDIDGERLLRRVGAAVRLRLESERLPARAEHVVARLPGSGAGRIVLSAHIDSRMGSPGALDNASGVATLLGVGALLAGWDGRPAVEIVPFNGEDHYANPGEMMWLEENQGCFGDIVVGINIDDSGMRGGLSHMSFYECPSDLELAARAVAERHPRVTEGPSWAQGDHMVFAMQGLPAIALTSSEMASFMEQYAHSDRDTVDLADPDLIAENVRFVRDVVAAVSDLGSG